MERRPIGGRSGPDRETACRFAEALVSASFSIGLAEMRGHTRGPAPAAFARQAAMYLAHVGLRLPLAEVGRYFGRDRTTVAHACKRVEDSRESPTVDRTIASLETALERWEWGFPGAGSWP
jgi:chromosomal replication initiation ATPase DnaA